MKPVNVMWVSRHKPLTSQVEELSRLFGEVSLTVAPEGSVSETLARYEALPEPRELVLVAPLAICREVLKRGVRPLSPKMMTMERSVVLNPDCECKVNGRVIRFLEFQRRVNVKETFEPVRRQRQ